MATNLRLKLVVDNEKKRVVFAEPDNDLVDIIFSFLTLPMGTIIKLLGKQSGVGCMDKLYSSVENLDIQHLETEACKMMLLQPRNASRRECDCLKINVDDPNPRDIYKCPDWECLTKTHRLFSNVPGARCRCGQVMDDIMTWRKRPVDTVDGVFVKGTASFMISDDLHVTPISTGSILSLLQRIGIRDADSLETRTVDVGKDEILSLLKRMLLSKTPLTDVFLKKQDWINICDSTDTQLFDHKITSSKVKVQSDAAIGSKTISVRLVKSKSTKKVAYAEAGEDLVDTLFSFITFPLGSILKLLNKHSSLVCADNLYQSVDVLSIGDDFIKSEECKNMLLAPKLPTHFGCINNLIRIDEEQFTTIPSLSCEKCFEEAHYKCLHGLKNVTVTNINPKLPIPGTEHGGGFAKRSVKFMVTNDMSVAPLSPTVVIDTVKELQVPIASLVEREITCGEAEVLNMLKACLISRTVLSNAFPMDGAGGHSL